MKNLPRRGFLPKVLFLFLLLFAFLSFPKAVLAQSVPAVDCNNLPTPPPKLQPINFYEPTYNQLKDLYHHISHPDFADLLKHTQSDTVPEVAVVDDSLKVTSAGQVSVSKMELPFAKQAADYLEGKFQDEDHRMANIVEMDSTQRHNYFGPLLKLTTQKQQDMVRRAYVTFVRSTLVLYDNNPNTTEPYSLLKEATYEYADVCGKNPRTLYDLLEGFKNVWNLDVVPPPSLLSQATSQDWEIWNRTWALWWPKIPIVPNEISQGCVEFLPKPSPPATPPPVNEQCPTLGNTSTIFTGVPDARRLANLSLLTQKLLVPFELIQNTIHRVIGKPEGPSDITGTLSNLYNSQTGQKVNSVAVNLPEGQDYIVRSNFPFFGRVFETEVSDTGGLRGFHPLGFSTQPEIFETSAKINTQWSFAGAGTASELRIWAGFLGGVDRAKKFVQQATYPFQKGTL